MFVLIKPCLRSQHLFLCCHCEVTLQSTMHKFHQKVERNFAPPAIAEP